MASDSCSLDRGLVFATHRRCRRRRASKSPGSEEVGDWDGVGGEEAWTNGLPTSVKRGWPVV